MNQTETLKFQPPLHISIYSKELPCNCQHTPKMSQSERNKTYLRRISKDISNQLHRERWWVDVSISDHKLLEDVVLNSPLKLALRHSLWTSVCAYK